MLKIGKYLIAGLAFLGSGLASASLVIPVYLTGTDGSEKKIGTVRADDTIYGVLLTPKLHDLPPGTHGFHIHAMASCNHEGMDRPRVDIGCVFRWATILRSRRTQGKARLDGRDHWKSRAYVRRWRGTRRARGYVQTAIARNIWLRRHVGSGAVHCLARSVC